MKRIKVWDLAVRATHLLFAVLVLGAFLTADEDANTPLHMRLGLGLLGLALFRVVWGFVGTRHARFSDFVRSPAAVRKALSELVRGRPERSLGHNPVGAVMVLMLLAALLTVTLTGVVVALGPEWSGPLALAKGSAHAVKEVHEVAAWTLVVLIGLHVAGVVTSSILEKQNLLLGMVTGFKDAPATTQVEPPALLPRPAGFVMACLVRRGGLRGVAPPARQQGRGRPPDPGGLRADGARGRPSLHRLQRGPRARPLLRGARHPLRQGRASCLACHPGASEGAFGEHQVRVPR